MTTDIDEKAPPPEAEHPSAGEMAAYIDGEVTDEERREIDAHLSACAHCRDELVVVREAMRSKGSRLRWAAGAVATAAAITLLLMTPAMLENGSEPVLRGPAADSAAGTAPAIEVVAPLEEGIDASSEPRFVWRSTGSGAHYRLTVTTRAGDPIATVTTSDTVVKSLPDAELAPDTEYYWWVEALRADRATAESGLQRFRTAP